MQKAAQDSLFSYQRKYRLARKEDFQFVFAKPQKTKLKFLIALSRPNSLSIPRVGIVVSKHKVKRAADRSWLRRIIRESFRHQKNILKGLDIIVLLRSECNPSLFLRKTVLRDDIDKLWQQLIGS